MYLCNVKQKSIKMKTKKFFISVLVILSSIISVNAQVYDPDIPVIELFAVEVHSVNDRVNDHRGELLSEEGGYVNLPASFYKQDGRSEGIIIVHDDTNTYHAFDRRCPVCFSKGQKGIFTMSGLLVAKCNNCSAEAQNIINWGSGQLTRYKAPSNGNPDYLIPYYVREEPRGDKLYLIIYPNPRSKRPVGYNDPANWY